MGFAVMKRLPGHLKKEAGFTPQQFRIKNNQFYFEKANIMDKFFQIQDEELLKKYPEIRVMKELEPLSVASYCYVGRDPEINAWSVMNSG